MHTSMTTLVLFFLLSNTLLFHRELSEALKPKNEELAKTPPRGWNSYDSFSWIISENEFLQNAEIVSKKLLPYGYEYVVVDFLWYRKKVKGAAVRVGGFDLIDEWGRLVPDPERWPSSKGGKGFTEVANKVHAMGLKFGIHVMRGLSTQAYNANTPVLDITKGGPYTESGRQWTTKDIGLSNKTCSWMSPCFMSVNTSLGAGKAFLRSLYQQYADWGVDFVKNDCIFGDDLDVDEIHFVSEVLNGFNRSIVYSLSPGTNATADMAAKVNNFVNMYRITSDDWDKWEDVESHFDVSRDFAAANMIGAKGLRGKSWPDLDMLPLGWLTDPESNEGPHRSSNLRLPERRTQMTLWSMAKSPLMFGGDMRKVDETTFNIIRNRVLLEINSHSSNNKEFPYISGTKDNVSNPVFINNSTHPKEYVLGLTDCMDQEAKGWASEFHDYKAQQLCWDNKTRRKSKPPFCLYKRNPLSALDNGSPEKKHKYEGALQLLAAEKDNFCLSASSVKNLTAAETKDIFSPCVVKDEQMWQLNPNGTLKNRYSGQCAKVTVKSATPNAGGIRSWIATGKKGKIYLSFFNLEPEKTVISTNISDVAKALPGRSIAICKYNEVWNKREKGVTKDRISVAVETHGCVLFVLSCS